MKLKDFMFEAMVAALYVALTLVFSWISYFGVQFRVAELLLLLVLFNKRHIWGVALGCFIANLLGPIGIIDAIWGTLATVIACGFMVWIKNYKISLLFPAIINGLIVGVYLHLMFDLPLALTMIQVALGEFVIVYLAGIPIVSKLKKQPRLLEIIE